MNTAYKPRVHYTPEQLQQAAIDDLLVDARCAEEQAATGRPDAAARAAYAVKCRAEAETLRVTPPKFDRNGWPVALK